MDRLDTYRAKRDFRRTPEPAPRRRLRAAPETPAIFVVQRHAASRLHYDFRLEWGGVLKSWAVPKGPSRDPALKRLAVQTEDHPVEYAEFEGDIPAGEYGGGHVDVWDRGTWVSEGDPEAAWRAGRLEFTLRGERLRGRWRLIRARTGRGKAQWLLMKARDAHALAGDDAEAPGESQGESPRESPGEPADEATAAVAAPSRRRRGGSSGKSAFPEFVEPQLATLVDAAPPGIEWLPELKLDGYRLLARIDGREVAVLTRNRTDWTARVPRLVRALAGLGLARSWLDGELVHPGAHGNTSFQKLQRAIGAGDEGLEYWVFDAPFLEGEDLRALPLRERRERLVRALDGHTRRGPLRLGAALDGEPAALLARLCREGQEGLILKDPDAPYAAGRGESWLKLKCRAEQEFVVGGYTLLEAGRPCLSSLVIGYHDGGRLHYAGKVGTGFTLADARALKRSFDRARRDDSPFVDRVPVRGHERVTWLEPEFVAQVAFAGWTADGRVRSPVYKGLREDKAPQAVTREQAVTRGRVATPTRADTRQRTATRKQADTRKQPDTGKQATSPARRGARGAAAVELTNPDRVLYPDPGITKQELADYYAAVADRLLPHLEGRPLSLVRSRDGAAFYQKHHRGVAPPGLESTCIDVGTGRRDYLVCRDMTGLASLAQLGVVELHTWGARLPDPLHADRLTFDLDPDPALGWRTVADAALMLRALLQDLGYESWCKTTGGKGLHVVVPLATRRPDWDAARTAARAVARYLCETVPTRFSAKPGDEHRQDRIYVDYLRNYGGATAVSAYSPRLRPGAPVSMPLAWRQLDGGEDLRGRRFELRKVAAWLRRRRDPWADYADAAQAFDGGAFAKLEKRRERRR